MHWCIFIFSWKLRRIQIAYTPCFCRQGSHLSCRWHEPAGDKQYVCASRSFYRRYKTLSHLFLSLSLDNFLFMISLMISKGSTICLKWRFNPTYLDCGSMKISGLILWAALVFEMGLRFEKGLISIIIPFFPISFSVSGGWNAFFSDCVHLLW